MIARLWFRPQGKVDGLWWTLELDGEAEHVSGVEILGKCRASWERRQDVPRDEQRHFIECIAANVSRRADGTVVIHGADIARD